MKEKCLNGKELAKKIKGELLLKVDKFKKINGISPKLAVITVGEDLSIEAYIRSKIRTCKKVGMECFIKRLPETSSFKEVRNVIYSLNEDESVHGMILELPIPSHIPYNEAVSCIAPCKDVDGLNPVNLGFLYMGDPGFIPSTPMAIMELIKNYNIPLEGRKITVVGRSLSVGKPIAALLISENATVTVCHSKTSDLSYHTSNADILVVSVGKPKIIKAEMVKEGAIVIDVGINVIEEGTVGDVDFLSVYPKVKKITPVPGGIGPLTVSMILQNTLKAANLQSGSNIEYHKISLFRNFLS